MQRLHAGRDGARYKSNRRHEIDGRTDVLNWADWYDSRHAASTAGPAYHSPYIICMLDLRYLRTPIWRTNPQSQTVQKHI